MKIAPAQVEGRLKWQRQSIRVDPTFARGGGTDQLGRKMRIHWCSSAPTLDDQVDSLPERQVDVIKSGKVSEQTHPKYGQSLVVEVIHPVVLRKGHDGMPHPIQRYISRIGFEITQCHRDVGLVRKVRRGDLSALKRQDECSHFMIVRESAGLDHNKRKRATQPNEARLLTRGCRKMPA